MGNIEWTDASWNPVTGRLREPLGWRRPRKIFVNEMSDSFHPTITDGFLVALWGIMARAWWHSFQILTKWPERMLAFVSRWSDLEGESDRVQLVRGPVATRAAHPSGRGQLFAAYLEWMGEPPAGAAWPTFDWLEGERWWPAFLPNVWLGVSVEDQRCADASIPYLLQTPAAVRFLSCEPLLGLVDLRLDPARPLDWVIAGGESGPAARPMQPDWVRSLRDQCQLAGVPFFFKQWGEWAPTKGGANMERIGKDAAGRLLDDRVWSEFPARRLSTRENHGC